MSLTMLPISFPITLLVLISPLVSASRMIHVNVNVNSNNGQHGCIDCDISERQRCECREELRLTGREVAYICDPESPDRFLICHAPNRVICQPCASGSRWNIDHQACGPIHKCAPSRCVKTTDCPTTTTTSSRWVPPPPTRPTPPQCDIYYEYHPEKLNWYSANRVCEANQGTLATIPNNEVQQYFRERFGATGKSNQLWLGASDRSREGSWQWVTGERFGFTNWYRSKPSSKRDKNCLIFNYWNKGMWSDEYCDYNKAFICQNLVCAK